MQGRRSGRRPHATAGARCALAAFCLLCSAAGAGTYAEEAPAVAEPPAHHHRYAVPSTVRSLASYSVPDLAMIRDDGQAVSLREELDDGAPVVLDFIYTTCTTVCSMSSRTFARLQQLLIHFGRVHFGEELAGPHARADVRVPGFQVAVGPRIDGRLDEGLRRARQRDFLLRGAALRRGDGHRDNAELLRFLRDDRQRAR